MDQSKFDNDTAAAIAAGMALGEAEIRLSEVRGVPLAIVPKDFRVDVLHEVLGTAEAKADTPSSRRGHANLSELASFTAHVNRFKAKHSAIFADTAKLELAAIYDYHPEGSDHEDALWCRHRAIYTCPRAKEWQEWCDHDGAAMSQELFGDWLEMRLHDLTSVSDEGESYPAPVDVLEMARNLRIHTRGKFERVINRTTGEYSLVAKEEQDSSSTRIHRAFLLALPIFEGGQLYRVEARIRFALREGKPTFSYHLHRRAELEADAFGDIRRAVIEQTGLPLFAGSPER